MTGDEFLIHVERQAKLVDAISSALEAMSLVNGCKMEMSGVAGTLHFDEQMLKLHEALLMLSTEPDVRPRASTGGAA